MSTTQAPLKYLYRALFQDGHIFEQPEDDQYSKHDPSADYNPSAFRDVLDYSDTSPLVEFCLYEDEHTYVRVNLETGEFANNVDAGGEFNFTLEETPLTDRKLIFFREVNWENTDGVVVPGYVNRYKIGYEGKNSDGNTEKRIMYLRG